MVVISLGRAQPALAADLGGGRRRCDPQTADAGWCSEMESIPGRAGRASSSDSFRETGRRTQEIGGACQARVCWAIAEEEGLYAPSSLHGRSGRGKNELEMRRMSLYIVVVVVVGLARVRVVWVWGAAGETGKGQGREVGRRERGVDRGARDATWRALF